MNERRLKIFFSCKSAVRKNVLVHFSTLINQCLISCAMSHSKRKRNKIRGKSYETFGIRIVCGNGWSTLWKNKNYSSFCKIIQTYCKSIDLGQEMWSQEQKISRDCPKSKTLSGISQNYFWELCHMRNLTSEYSYHIQYPQLTNTPSHYKPAMVLWITSFFKLYGCKKKRFKILLVEKKMKKCFYLMEEAVNWQKPE